MAIGSHHCEIAGNTHLKEAVRIGLDECLTALEESFYDLSDEHVQSFPVAGKNNIAWIAMHCLDNLDGNAVGVHTGGRVTSHDERWGLWQCRPDERPKPGGLFPSVADMLDWLGRIRVAAMSALDDSSEGDMIAPAGDHPSKPLRSDWYMRTIYHTISHTRQIWLLRGALGLVEGPWPEQHWA